MDRGFGSSFRGSGFGGGPNRQISDRRYDDFYSDNGRRAGQQQGQGRSPAQQGQGRSPAGGGNPNRNRNSGEWGGSNRDRGFFNQSQGAGPGAGAGRDRDSSGNVSGQMLAALQQQQNLLNAFMTQSQSRGILPAPRGNSYGQGGKGGRYGGRPGPGDKRKQDMAPSGFQNKRNRRPLPRPARPAPPKPSPRRSSSASKTKGSSQERSKGKSPRKEEVVEVPDIPDDEVEIPDSLMESVEKLRQRKDVQRNVADEDIQKMLTFSFTGKGYQCLICGLLLMKESAFLQHLDSKSHVMKVIDARTAKKYQPIRDILDIDLAIDDWYEKSETAKSIIFKQAKVIMKVQRDIKQREIDNYNKNPANFFTVSMETRKAAVKSGSTVTIKSVVETSMEIKDFASDKFFGCEFIKATSGFDCRLCNHHIKESNGVIPHIESRTHKNNYQQHLRKVTGYEKVQKEQNTELSEALKDHEDTFVLLTESSKAESAPFLSSMDSQLVKVEKLFRPDAVVAAAQKKKEDEEKKKKEDAEAAVVAEKKKAADDAKETEKTTEKPDEAVVESKEGEEEKKDAPEEGGAEETEEKDGEGEETQDEPMDAEESEVKEEEEEVEGDEEEEEVKGDEEAVPNEESSDPYDPYDPANAKAEESGTVEDEPTVNGEEKEEVKAVEPKKSILKKTASRTPRGGAAAKRGRGRGAKATPSPRGRGKKTKEEPADVEQPQDEANDGSFMGAFQVVDEVEEE